MVDLQPASLRVDLALKIHSTVLQHRAARAIITPEHTSDNCRVNSVLTGTNGRYKLGLFVALLLQDCIFLKIRQ